MREARATETDTSVAAARILTDAAAELLRLGQFAQAAELARLALAEHEAMPAAHGVLAATLDETGDQREAMAHWQRAAALAPREPQFAFNLALALLLRGRYREGLRHYEARMLHGERWISLAAKGSFEGLHHRMPRPGDDLRGKNVLVFTEQGLGDCLWAARWLPALAGTGARVTLACRPTLRPLLASVPGVEAVVTPPPDQPQAKINLGMLSGRFQHFLPIMSLPWILGVDETDLLRGAALPWCRPDPDRVAHWRHRYETAAPGARRRVGLVWRVNPESASYYQRLLPLRDFAALARADVQVINLQGGVSEGRQALASVVPGFLDPLTDGEPPLNEYAAMLAATDLLLTTDTMPAHLAGSIGHPCHVAVPAAPAFYWVLGRDDSPWYPRMRLFRQARRGDWIAPIAAMIAAGLELPT